MLHSKNNKRLQEQRIMLLFVQVAIPIVVSIVILTIRYTVTEKDMDGY